MKWVSPKHVLIAVLLVSAALRFQGLTWGTDPDTGEFRGFHPDETTIVQSSGLVGVDLKAIKAPYQKMPMYLLAGAVRVAGWLTGVPPFAAGDNRSSKLSHIVGRAISALFGTLTVLVVFWIGKELGGEWMGVLSAGLLGFCAAHIQQCHYYTVDVSMTLWICIALAAFIRMPSDGWIPYVVGGAAWGMAGGTRLLAVVLGLPFLIIHLRPEPGEGAWWRRIGWRRLLSVKLVVCGLTAVVLTLVGEPFLLWDPDLLFGDDDLKRFAQAMNVAQGEIVRIWTLYDFSTTPYLFFITHLFRYAMGLPLEIAALAGLALAARSRNRGWLPILLWLGIYFLLVGRLHTKPIRYTTPMLPFLSISAAAACIWAGARIRAWGRLSTAFSYALPIALIGIPTSMYGLAMAGVFQKKDSRLEAVKWIRENIPPGDKVLTERGGFSTQWMVPPDRYDRSVDEATFFIMTEGQYLYRDKVDFFAKKLKNVPWIAIVEENRLRQYREAREAFPIGWEYYTRLENGTLGYNRAATFKVSPQIPGWVFDETEAEPTVTAFDHPRVSVYKRGNTDVDSMLASWREDTAANPLFPDPFVREGVKAFQDGDFVAAEGAFRKALGPRPDFKLGHLLMFETFKQQGLRDSAAVHLQAARGKDGLRREILVGFIKTGMRREAIVYLHGYVTTIEIKDSRDMYLVRFAAQTWFDLGVESFSNRSFDQAAADFLKAVELVPDFAPTHMNLGNLYLKLEDFEASRQHLNRVIELDSTQAEPHYRLAQGARMEERYAEARIHIRKALVMEPGRRLYLQELTRQGVVLYEAGRHEEAVSWYQEVLLTLPESSETLHNLGLALFSLGRYPDARVPFEAAAQLAPAQAATRFSLGRTYEMLGLKDQAISSYWTALELEPGNRDAQGRLEALGIGSDS